MTAFARRWAAGVCARNHDVTDPANVRTWIDKNGSVRQECLPCRTVRENAYQAGTIVAPACVFPPRTCEQCDKIYLHRNRGETRQRWARRRYCSRDCLALALAERNRDQAQCGSRGPLSDADVARLRHAVGLA